jgi:hydroxymethylbilane synthase
VRIATRASPLALAQARWVAERLPGPATIVEVVTTGDRRRAVADKREWVAELEDALLRGEADIAVHSAKDVPIRLADGLALIGAPPREDPRDVLCGAPSLDGVRRVGTASLRRAAQIRARWPEVEIVPLRGNVDTRLRKLAAGEADAIVLAAAGLARLGRMDAATAPLDLVPAAGQGILAIEARAGDEAARAAVAGLRDPDTEAALRCERALVAGLDADCRTPVGAHAVVRDGRLTLRAFVGRPDGSAWLVDERAGTDPEALGAEVAERLLAAGAAELLDAGAGEAA